MFEMTTTINNIVIAGAGQAGATVALGLRKAGFEGRVTLVGEEVHLPYERPQLSKEMLRPNLSHRTIKSLADYEKLRIELDLGRRVASVDPRACQVVLDDGRTLEYDRLVIATGVRPRRLPESLDGRGRARYLRTLEDALHLREDIEVGRQLAIIGGGVIGLEVASAARAAGCEVTLVEAADRLMPRSVDKVVSDYLARSHRGDGIDIRFGVSAVEFVDEGWLKLSDGSRVRAECMLVGIGVVPNTEGFAHLGITDAAGVRVNSNGRSAIPNIYATGDIASQPHGNGHGRIETWANAQDHALNLVRNLLGEDLPYQSPTWFWSDQGRINLQVVGNAIQGVQVIRGDEHGDSFSIFWLDDNHRVTGCSSVNAAKDMALARRWVKQGSKVDPVKLADTAISLRDCAM